MSGNMGALSSIVELKRKIIILDYLLTMHMDLVLMGKTGAGCGEEQGVQDEIDPFSQPLLSQWQVLVPLFQVMQISLIILDIK